MHEYATVAEVKKSLELQGETFADADITRALASASRGLDQMLDRRFWLDTDATSVRYYGRKDIVESDGQTLLIIDDLVDLTSVLADDDGDGVFETTWTENTDFILLPLNAEADGEPYTMIELGRSAPCQTRALKITGQFGWAEVPVGVNQATIILTAKLVRRAREAPFGVVSVGLDTAMRLARSDPDVMFLVGDYDRSTVAIA